MPHPRTYDRAEIKRLYDEEHLSAADIAERLGAKRHTITRILPTITETRGPSDPIRRAKRSEKMRQVMKGRPMHENTRRALAAKNSGAQRRIPVPDEVRPVYNLWRYKYGQPREVAIAEALRAAEAR